MIPLYSLHYVLTSDGITLDGAVAAPKKRTRKIILWIHGLGGNFFSGRKRLREVAAACLKGNIAFATFNTRGYDTVASFRIRNKKSYLLAGAALERFTDCIKDLRAIIGYLKKSGFSEIYLAGHSTGANKGLYYLYKTRDPRVKGLALIAPLSDVDIEMRATGKLFNKKLAQARKYLKNYADWPMPKGFSPKMQSARRYLSLSQPDGTEDIFPYYNPHASWKELRNIRKPILVAIGERDEYRGKHTARKLINIFARHATGTKSFTGKVIPGATHGFKKSEITLGNTLATWVNYRAQPHRSSPV